MLYRSASSRDRPSSKLVKHFSSLYMSRVPGGWFCQRLLCLRCIMSFLTKGLKCRVDAVVVPCRAAVAAVGPMLATTALRTAL